MQQANELDSAPNPQTELYCVHEKDKRESERHDKPTAAGV